jgi:hypothetical protein
MFFKDLDEIEKMIEQLLKERNNFSTHLRTRKLRAELILLTIDIGIKTSING